jgi:hypothetical protein
MMDDTQDTAAKCSSSPKNKKRLNIAKTMTSAIRNDASITTPDFYRSVHLTPYLASKTYSHR